MSKCLILVDCESLFYGLKRMTGDSFARVDYSKLKNLLVDNVEETMLVAYVVTPVSVDPKYYANRSIRRGSYIDDKFVNRLKDLGYRVRRQFSQPIIEGERQVRFSKSSAVREMVFDALHYLDVVDKIIIVSGNGVLAEAAKAAKAKGKIAWVACFDKAGDLHREFRAVVDRVIPLDESLKLPYSPFKINLGADETKNKS